MYAINLTSEGWSYANFLITQSDKAAMHPITVMHTASKALSWHMDIAAAMKCSASRCTTAINSTWL